jgi:hypothetical protein
MQRELLRSKPSTRDEGFKNQGHARWMSCSMEQVLMETLQIEVIKTAIGHGTVGPLLFFR